MNVDILGMTDYKDILGYLATIIAFIAIAPYFWDIYKGRTKPHAFSWLIWGILEAIGFAAQIFGNGGPGAWATAATSLICFTIAGIAFWKGEIKFILFDWLSLTGAGLAILLWLFTKSPFYSIFLITAADLVGFLPTYRKSYHLPFTETLSEYVLSSIKEIIALFALTTLSFITGFYIGAVAAANIIFVTMVLIRRRQLSKPKTA